MLTKPNLTYLLRGLLIAIVALIVFNNDGYSYNLKVLGTSFIICSFAIIKILSNKAYLFSLNSIFYLFVLFFIGLAPALQFKQNTFFLGVNSKLSHEDFLFGNLFFLLCILIYYFVYEWSHKKKMIQKFIFKRDKCIQFNIKIMLLLSFLVALIILAYFSFNLEPLFQRQFLWRAKWGYSSVFLSSINVLRGIPLIIFIFFKLSNKKNLVIEITLLLVVIFCNFPLGISRYKIAVTYLPILLVYFKPLLKKRTFPIAFIILFMSVFPYLHHFRYNNNLLPEKVFDSEMFVEAHFDSYQNSVNVVTNKVVTNGNQVLGTILFFIPRSYWETKSIGSGYVLAEALDYNGFSNVAVSYFAEGYINFGYLGVFVFTILLALVNSSFDRYYWLHRSKNNVLFQTFYLVLLPFQFIILRGSLMSSAANLMGYLVCIILIFYISKLSVKQN